jgi:hypothetical protein
MHRFKEISYSTWNVVFIFFSTDFVRNNFCFDEMFASYASVTPEMLPETFVGVRVQRPLLFSGSRTVNCGQTDMPKLIGKVCNISLRTRQDGLSCDGAPSSSHESV